MFVKHCKLALGVSLSAVVLTSCAQNFKHNESNKSFQLSSENKAKLESVVVSRNTKTKARDAVRKPAETLAFFRVEPGMTVAEALPGGGWYTKIIADYLGKDGTIYGVNYDDDMWEKFGFFTPEAIEKRIAGNAKFPETVAKITNNGIKSQGFTFSSAPDSIKGTVDRVLVIRALHNLNRFENDGGFGTKAVNAMHKMLKKGGMVGVVQHKVAETADDAGAQGQRGYLKESAVIAMFKKAGFQLIDKSDMHANPKDQPGAKDVVWRLPPTLSGSRDNPELKAKMQAIGESNRMTLLFKKP